VLLFADGGLARPKFSIRRTIEEVMLIKFFRDENGLELAEYAVIAALIVLATVAAFSLLNERIAARIETLAGFIQ
jgi:Flp pilus assembly pilin Flp